MTGQAGWYRYSMFMVALISLSASWVVAVLFSPLLGTLILPYFNHNRSYTELAREVAGRARELAGDKACVQAHRLQPGHRALFAYYGPIRFCRDVDAGRDTVLDPYAAHGPDEFFAVASESFFVTPAALRDAHPALYPLLAGFYRQDPAAA